MTEGGAARAELDGEPVTARFLLVLTHGAGGTVETPDLLAARDAALRLGGMVARVTQPYRVRGARAPGSAARQDAAWAEIVAALRTLWPAAPLVQGGRSNGARVACRTADQSGALAVLCLAFPLHPPGRAHDPSKSRLPELEEVALPTLVVQGERDPFGMPPEGPRRKVISVPGDHSLRDAQAVGVAVSQWLSELVVLSR